MTTDFYNLPKHIKKFKKQKRDIVKEKPTLLKRFLKKIPRNKIIKQKNKQNKIYKINQTMLK